MNPRWDALREAEERAYERRRLAMGGSAFWEHEASQHERTLGRMEMGDFEDD